MKISGRMKNVAKISSGTILGQIISIITLPLITRIYNAEIIGSWSAISAIATILVYCVDLGLSQAIMVESDKGVEKLYQMISTISLFICFPAYFISLVYYLASGYDFSTALIHAFFVIVYAYTMRQVQTCYTWLNREKQYNILMKNPVINFLSVAIFSIVFGLMGFKNYGYFWGVTLGQFFTLLNMKTAMPKKMFYFNREYYKRVIATHSDYVKYQMPSLVSAQLRQSLPNLLIGLLFGNEILGYFSISQRLLNLPINFIGQSLGRVFYQTIAEMKRAGKEIGLFLQRNMDRATKLAVIPMLLFAAFGDVAIVIFFGKEYELGGTISRIVVFRSLFNFLSTSLSGIDIVTEQQKRTLQTCLMQTILSSLSVIVGYYAFDSIIITVWLIVITFDLMQVWYFVKIYKSLNLSPVKYIRKVVTTLIITAIGAALLRFIFIQFALFLNIPIFNYLLECLT
jgi:O-antigen/teichoic acid export membrane protein